MALNTLRKYLKLEATSGVILFMMAVIALILDNSPLAEWYQSILQMPMEVGAGHWQLKGSLLFWINEGLMSIFFLLVGLELKREFVMGELSELSKVILPGVAAIGGMVVPALLYIVICRHDPLALNGWAVPVATDIAFALGVLSLFGKRIPIELKLFLMTLAIFDDVGAIIIIAFSHSKSLSLFSLLSSAVWILVLWSLNRWGVRRLVPYLFFGLLLWLSVLKSGVHATVAGVLFAFLIPIGSSEEASSSPLERLETLLHPWVAYFVMPLFALANAGLSFKEVSISSLLGVVMVGVMVGLFLGKQLGVFLFSWVMIKLGWAKLPGGASWLHLYGVSILCGIGFTMSLFLGNLAFYGSSAIYLHEVRLGVLLGSLLSGVVGSLVLSRAILASHSKGDQN